MKDAKAIKSGPARYLILIDKDTLGKIRSLCKEVGIEQGKFATRVFDDFLSKPEDVQRKIMVGL